MTAGRIAEARARAEAATLRCTCQITRPATSGGHVDPATGKAVRAAPTVVAEGPCSVGNPKTSASGERADRQTEGVEVPVRTTVEVAAVVRPGDTLTVTEIDGDGDPELVGVPLTVVVVPRRSRVVLPRITCVDTRGTDRRVP